MCGIAGYVGYKEISENTIQRVRQALYHRGPDDSGLFTHHSSSGLNVYFVHTRLSIIDAEKTASQPMTSHGNTIIFNGEIYNYIELRKKLIAKGASFKTRGDTEVLLNLLIEEGITGLNYAEGMWALALFNHKRETLYLSRDRFGEKPLYFIQDQKGIYFASEYLALFQLYGRTPDVNMHKLMTHLYGGYRLLYNSADTFFRVTSELKAHHYLKIQAGKIKDYRAYWTPSFRQDEKMGLDEAIDTTKQLLISEVGKCLRADVPIAFCMSGGVDSNALISIASKVYKYDVHGFTIKSCDHRYDESSLVNSAIDDLSIKHSFVTLSHTHFLSDLQAVIKKRMAPIYTISYYIHWLLMSKISEFGYKVSISGTAADELFTGYYDHFLFYLASIQNNSKLFLESESNWVEYVRPVLRNKYFQNSRLFVDNPGFRKHLFADNEAFLNFCTKDFNVSFSETSYCDDLLRNRMLNELFSEVVPVILNQDDLNAMYFSIENRTPFLSKVLFEYIQRIPTKYLIQQGYAKYILRQAIREFAPYQIVNNRQKYGFNAGIYDMLVPHSEEFQDLLCSASCIYDFVDKKKLIDSLNKREISEKFLFNFICSKIFLDEIKSIGSTSVSHIGNVSA